MKKILIVYTKMVIGGSTTSLLSLLNNIDYKKYEVSLQLLDNNGPLQYAINKNVIILPELSKYSFFKRFLHPVSIMNRFLGMIASYKNNSKLVRAQYNSLMYARSFAKIDKYYDIALSYLEFTSNRYLCEMVNAGKKICWVHIDPYEARLVPGKNCSSLNKASKIVLVSNSCYKNFNMMYPTLSHKSYIVPNILDSKIIKKFAEEEVEYYVDKNDINLVTVARVNFASKGHDRALNALKSVKADGYDIAKLKWHIIGDGPDFQKLSDLITKYDLKENVVLLGEKMNPHPYVKDMDIFFLPSKYEGKPMAVTEAQMLGVPTVVCNYSSSSEQVKDNLNGLILENSEESIYRFFVSLINGDVDYESFRSNLKQSEFSNLSDMEKIYELFI